MSMRLGEALVWLLAFIAVGTVRADTPPSVVVILLDTTRADRFGSWGSGRDTTPVLDRLAAEGAQFVRHYANSHATRPSLPQIVSGRYFHPSVLRPFEPDSHPRDYPFLLPDPGARLLTDLVRQAGFHLVGVTAHPWVDPASTMGRSFHHLEFVEAEPKRGHASAEQVLDRAITLWDGRPRDRPTFLYVHLLDTHVPRWVPADGPGFLAPGTAWQPRFRRSGEPRFGSDRRRWEFTDARDFTAGDRAVYAAIYDTALRRADAELARFLEHLRASDPDLEQTLVVVLADHGEQLGEEGALRHGDSLVDGIQHTPLIMAGAGITPGQRVETFTENIDVAPTMASLLGMSLPPGTFDGRILIDQSGRVMAPKEPRSAVFYAWSDYQAVRTKRWLLRVDPPGAPQARCRGSETTLWRIEPDGRRTRVDDARRAAVLREKVRRRLGRGAARLEEGLRTQPAEPFFVPVDYWRLADPRQVTCVPIDGGPRPEALQAPGWLLVRGGLVILEGTAEPLSVTLTVPDGAYQVAAGVRPLGWMWRLPGMLERAAEALRSDEAETFVELDEARASGRRLEVRVPVAVGEGQRIVNLRLTPHGAGPKDAPTVDAEQQERLRTLGYVE